MKRVLLLLLLLPATSFAGEVRLAGGQEAIHETDGQVLSLSVGAFSYDNLDDNQFISWNFLRFGKGLFLRGGFGLSTETTHSIGRHFIGRAEVGLRLGPLSLSLAHWSTPFVRDRGDNAVLLGFSRPF